MTAGYCFGPPPRPSAEIVGRAERFPIRRILCVGRNYRAHAREMGADERDPPFFFAKPADALAPGGAIPFPPATQDLQHEVELVVAVGAPLFEAGADEAAAAVFGYGVGVDLTRRDLQAAAKERGHPWEAGKAFDASAPMGPLHPWAGPEPRGRIWLEVDGRLRQEDRLESMVWSPSEILAQASGLWRLAPGDLLFTGTPAGVGRLERGQHVACGVDGLGRLNFTLV